MHEEPTLNYERVAQAITYIKAYFQDQPELEEIAEKIHLSPSHFQRLFTEWAGTSPKKFLQYISISHAKQLLQESGATIFDAAFATGLSSTSRLHDLFISIEGMTPAEFKSGGKKLSINYQFAESPFGTLFVASTAKGICSMGFVEEGENALVALQQKFPEALFYETPDAFQQSALSIFGNGKAPLQTIKLHLKGTPFQLKVWECLLKIPMGKLTTYGTLARQIGQPNAARAVGTAIGSNPVAFLIPCHRVIQASGKFDGYFWGTVRKTAMIGWEQSRTQW